MYWHGTLSADMVSSSRPLQLYVAKVPLHLYQIKLQLQHTQPHVYIREQ